MGSRNRLEALKKWTFEQVCKGRIMKTAGDSLLEIVRQEPKVYLGFWPTRPDASGQMCIDQIASIPGILIMPMPSQLKYVEDKRFDTYNHIRREQQYGQWLNVCILFAVYEPGIRLKGFVESGNSREGLDMTKFKEGTEEGLLTLMDWMDEFNAALLAARTIPESDLTLDESTAEYGLYAGTDFDVDKRPIYYGMVNAKFQCYAREAGKNSIDELLE